jgi:hypothetical protein
LIVPRALVESGRFIYNNRSGIDATLQWLAPSVEFSKAFPSVHRDGGSVAVQDAMVWLAMFVGVMLAALMMKRSNAIRWTLVVSFAAIGTMVAAGMVWRIHAPSSFSVGGDYSPTLAEDRSALAAVGAYRPLWHRVLVDVSERRLISSADFFGAMHFQVRGRINRVPAGEYEVTTVTPPATVAMTVGRSAAPLETPELDPSFKLNLPASLQTLDVSVIGGQTPEEWSGISIAPLSVRSPAASRFAIRAARYGHARAFFFDEQAYPEKDGFWTRAGGAAEVMIDTDQDTKLPGLPITVTAGAVDTTIEVSVGSWSESFPLAAGRQHELMLPPAVQRAWTMRIRSGPGFRPSERDPANRDVRLLAAWIAIR